MNNERGKGDMNVKETRTIIQYSTGSAGTNLTEREGSAESNIAVATAVLTACRLALIKGAVACRAALKKHRASIGPDRTNTLEIVGDYDSKVLIIDTQTLSFFLESSLSCFSILVALLYMNPRGKGMR